MPQERGSAKGDDMSATDSPVVKAILARTSAIVERIERDLQRNKQP